LNSVAWHVLAILHHFLASAAALFFLRRLGLSLTLSWLAALFFVVHPVHGESVSWIAAAFNDPPTATLTFLTLGAHASWLATGKRRYLVFAAVGFAGALLLKESALSILLLVPVVDGWMRPDRSWWNVALRYLPFALCLGVYSAVGRWIDGIVPDLMPGSAEVGAALATHPHAVLLGQLLPMLGLLYLLYHGKFGRRLGGKKAFWNFAPYLLVTLLYLYVRRLAIVFMFGFAHTERVLEMPATFPSLGVFYLRLLFWPFGLSPSYPLRPVESWASPAAYGWLIVLLAIALLTVLAVRNNRFLQACCLWFVCSVWPVFNISSFRETYLVHQRYLCLSCFGMCAAVAWLVMNKLEGRWRRGAATAILLLWASSNYLYNPGWSTDVKLWQRIAVVDPKNPASFDFLGTVAAKAGRHQEAADYFARAIEADPESPVGYGNLAFLQHTRLKDYRGALENYRAALDRYLRQLPGGSGGVESYVACRINYASCLAESGDREAALRELLETFETYRSADAAENAAVLFLQAGDLPGLLDILRRGVDRHPEHVGLLAKLCEVYVRLGDDSGAAACVERLRELSPDAGPVREYDRRIGAGR